MGTAITLAGRRLDDESADRFFRRIRDLELVLSRFLPESDLSRLADGRVGLDDVDWAVREVLTRCIDLRHRTDGWFDHEPGRSLLDPDALAKGWIVEQAALELRVAGVPEFFVNAGGDVLVHRPHPSNPYRVGVQHPREPEAVVAVLEVTDGAVATSGTYERGDHIRGGDNGRVLSATVAGPELGECDALVTAVFAAGQPVPGWWERFSARHSLLTVTADDRIHWRTPTAGTPARRTCRLAG
jgi:thiamine biosynthesis lipoprotein